MKVRRKIIEINEELCDGCGVCVPSCAEGAIQVEGGKARVLADQYCDGLGACIGECPKGALKIIERTADEFDEEAVEAHLHRWEGEEAACKETMACGCPSSLIQSFIPSSGRNAGHEPATDLDTGSHLSHWPVQIRLVPPTAPFLKGADLVVAADCTPVAYPHFHRDFLKDRVVMMGCPKFDDVGAYIEKFADIFKTADIKSVIVLDMEVPCCSALLPVVKKGMESAGKRVPLEEIVIGTRGKILERERRG